MSTDLIERLRSVDRVFATEAADRIEQLERENAELQSKLESADKRCTQSMTDLVNNIVADRRW
jgi:hypothetical protein